MIGLRYIITTHRHLAGARLSKSGHWTNEPFASDAAARRAATADAAGRPFTIEHERVNKRLTEFGQ